MCVCVCLHKYVYMCIYREREIDSQMDRMRDRKKYIERIENWGREGEVLQIGKARELGHFSFSKCGSTNLWFALDCRVRDFFPTL